MSISKATKTITQPATAPHAYPLKNGRRETYLRNQALELNARRFTFNQILKRLFGIKSPEDEVNETPDYWQKPSDNQMSPGHKNLRLRELRLQWLLEVLQEAKDES